MPFARFQRLCAHSCQHPWSAMSIVRIVRVPTSQYIMRLPSSIQHPSIHPSITLLIHPTSKQNQPIEPASRTKRPSQHTTFTMNTFRHITTIPHPTTISTNMTLSDDLPGPILHRPLSSIPITPTPTPVEHREQPQPAMPTTQSTRHLAFYANYVVHGDARREHVGARRKASGKS